MAQRPLIATLGAFLDAALRPPTALARTIVIVLAVKFVAVMAMAAYFHFVNQHAVADAAAIGRLLGPASLP
jgi:hypothetical protein